MKKTTLITLFMLTLAGLSAAAQNMRHSQEQQHKEATATDAQQEAGGGLSALPLHRYDAKLDGKIPVVIAFQQNADNTVAGYIYYPKAKHPAPILLVGIVMHEKGSEYYSLTEYQPDGRTSGYMTIEHDGKGKMEGTWGDPKTMKEHKLTDMRHSSERPAWFTASLLTPERPDNIGKEYSYERWNPRYKAYMGGHITFRAAGKNRIHFDCSNAERNIAEGKSAEGRPAVLKGNVFEYHDVNECGYGFKATFYPRFVVLESLTTGETLNCFGAFASFDGIYIKVKK